MIPEKYFTTKAHDNNSIVTTGMNPTTEISVIDSYTKNKEIPDLSIKLEKTGVEIFSDNKPRRVIIKAKIVHD
ncbi:MAG: hypothetical protein ACC612_01475 [Methanomethylovorans sp.]|uniref:hypothetical protein n=1 Tax=Methanomethylovorans sp. TaxID=2758717 RepID=UPI0035314B4F